MAKKETTTDGQSGQEAPVAPALPPFPAFSQTPLGQRMALMASNPDTSPVWMNTPTSYSNIGPIPNLLTSTGTVSPYTAPPPTPNFASSKESPTPTPTGTAPAQSPWAAANPLARPEGPPRFGDDIRSDIFRQIYRTGKHADNAAGAMLMNVGKPPLPDANPLGPTEETAPEPPRYLDNAGNTSPPQLNISGNNSYGAPPQAQATPGYGGGPAGRLARRMGSGGQGANALAPMRALGMGPAGTHQPMPPAQGPAFSPIRRGAPAGGATRPATRRVTRSTLRPPR